MAGYDGRGARYDIDVPLGNDLSVAVTAVDSDSAAVDLSAATIVATIYDKTDTALDTFSASVGGAGSNVITLSLTDTEVDALTSPTSWALVVTRSGDSRTWAAGRFNVTSKDRPRNGSTSTTITATVDTNVTVTLSAITAADSAPGVQLPIANGTDDTTAIQAVLTASAGKTIYGVPGESYKISAPLVISSDTTLDMTGCTITLVASSNCNMIVNAAYNAGTGRDNDITIIGGTWARGANDGTNNARHSIVVISCDRVKVSGIHYTADSGGGKYGIWIGEANDVVVEHCTSASLASDFVHLNGPMARFYVDDIRGTSGDDFVAVAGYDYPYIAAGIPSTYGNVTDGTISNIRASAAGASVVRIFAGDGPLIRDVSIENVSGAAGEVVGTGNVVNIGDDTTQTTSTGMDVDRIFIRGVSGTVQANYGIVNFQGAGMGKVHVSDVICDQPTDIAYAVSVQGSTTIDDLQIVGMAVEGTVNHGGISVADGATIGALHLSDVTAIFPADNTVGRFIIFSEHPSRLVCSNVVQTGGQYCIYSTSNTNTALKATLSNFYIDDVSNGVWSNNGSGAVTAYVSNLVVPGQTAFQVTGASASLTLFASASTCVAWFYRSSTQTVRANGACIRCDTGILTPQKGDIVYNTDAAESQGAGLSVRGASAWVNLAP